MVDKITQALTSTLSVNPSTLRTDELNDIINAGNLFLQLQQKEIASRLYDMARDRSEHGTNQHRAALKSIITVNILNGVPTIDDEEMLFSIIQEDPSDSLAHYLMGQIQYIFGRFDAARLYLETALKLFQESVDILRNLANVYHLQGKHKQALNCYKKGLDINIDNIESQFYYGMSRLLVHGIADKEGQKLYGARKKGMIFKLNEEKIPFLDLNNIRNTEICDSHITIVVTTEQGVGDVIMGLGYIKDLRNLILNNVDIHEDFLHIGVCVNKIAAEVVKNIDGVDFVVEDEAGAIEEYCNYQVPVLDLFLKFFNKNSYRNTYMKFPDYMKDLRQDVRGKVGCCWQGNKDHKNDRFRSMTAGTMETIVGGLNYDIMPIQYQATCDDLNIFKYDNSLHMHPKETLLGQCLIAANLKAIVTVDTAMAHIAGALGTPCVLLLPTLPDWRWGTKGNRTPIYNSVRIVRQEKPLVWDSKIEEKVRLELYGLLKQ